MIDRFLTQRSSVCCCLLPKCFFCLFLCLPRTGIAQFQAEDSSIEMPLGDPVFWVDGDQVLLGYTVKRSLFLGGDQAGVVRFRPGEKEVKFQKSELPSAIGIKAVCCDPRSDAAPGFVFAKRMGKSKVQLLCADADMKSVETIASVNIPWTYNSYLTSDRGSDEVWLVSPNEYAVGSDVPEAKTDIVCLNLAHQAESFRGNLKGLLMGVEHSQQRTMFRGAYFENRFGVIYAVTTVDKDVKSHVLKSDCSYIAQAGQGYLASDRSSFYRIDNLSQLLDLAGQGEVLMTAHRPMPWRTVFVGVNKQLVIAAFTNWNRGQKSTHVVIRKLSQPPTSTMLVRKYTSPLVAAKLFRDNELILCLRDRMIVIPTGQLMNSQPLEVDDGP